MSNDNVKRHVGKRIIGYSLAGFLEPDLDEFLPSSPSSRLLSESLDFRLNRAIRDQQSE